MTQIAVPEVTKANLADAAQAARIDAFVHAQPDATPFHRPQWSQAIEGATGNKAFYLVAEADGVITGVLPLTHMKSMLFGSALASAGFAVDGGVLAVDDATRDELVEHATVLAEMLNCPSIELRGGPQPAGWQVDADTYAGFVRDLPRDEDAILKAIPRKQRAEVRKALDGNFDVSFGSDLASHYRVYAESVRNLGTPVFPKKLFRETLKAFGTDADILIIAKDGQPLSAVLSLYFNGIVYPYWGGGTFGARAARSNELLYFKLMVHAAERGCTRFDFGRSKTGTGPYAYKKNWGFDPQPLSYARWGSKRETNPTASQYQRKVEMWKKLPLWAANLIGPHLSRGLG